MKYLERELSLTVSLVSQTTSSLFFAVSGPVTSQDFFCNESSVDWISVGKATNILEEKGTGIWSLIPKQNRKREDPRCLVHLHEKPLLLILCPLRLWDIFLSYDTG